MVMLALKAGSWTVFISDPARHDVSTSQPSILTASVVDEVSLSRGVTTGTSRLSSVQALAKLGKAVRIRATVSTGSDNPYLSI